MLMQMDSSKLSITLLTLSTDSELLELTYQLPLPLLLLNLLLPLFSTFPSL
jgi:hypothetical protein